MSTFEEKMARLREKEEREKQREEQKREKKRTLKQRYGMKPRYKENLIKSLEKQIKEAPTPELKARLTANLTRVLTVNPEARARRSKDFPNKAPKKTSDIVAKWTDRLSHLPEEKRVEMSVILEVEERRRKASGPTAISAVVEEVMGLLSDEDRAALNSEAFA